MLMRAAAAQYGWKLNYGGVALMWRGGCIIRSVFLGKIKEAFERNAKLTNLMLDDYFRGEIKKCQKLLAQRWWRRRSRKASRCPPSARRWPFTMPIAARLPANLLQAQRDYFGAHTYERVDQPRGQFFHTNWTGRGGDVASGTYNA
jgi:6-phosphogluconate dehydrogenase